MEQKVKQLTASVKEVSHKKKRVSDERVMFNGLFN